MSLRQILAKLRSLLEHEPAVLLYGLTATLIPVLSLTLHWNSRQTAAASAILTGLSTIAAAWKARPVSVPSITGGALTIVEALAAWHVTIPAADLSMITASVSALLGALLRANLTPVASLRDHLAGGR